MFIKSILTFIIGSVLMVPLMSYADKYPCYFLWKNTTTDYMLSGLVNDNGVEGLPASFNPGDSMTPYINWDTGNTNQKWVWTYYVYKKNARGEWQPLSDQDYVKFTLKSDANGKPMMVHQVWGYSAIAPQYCAASLSTDSQGSGNTKNDCSSKTKPYLWIEENGSSCW